MNQEKIGQIIKDNRIKKGYTQVELATLLGVSSQAVSKWELGKSIPDISMLQCLCKEFNLNVDELLNGDQQMDTNKKLNNKKLILLIAILILVSLSLVIFTILHFSDNHDDFEFKTISASCDNFKIIGSVAYNKNKTSIYISNIDYCGKKNDTIYTKITWDLYEKYGNTHVVISSGNDEQKDITLDEYLSNITINVDNYTAMCKKFSESGLFLEISAYDGEEKTIFEIPLKLKNNC